MNRYDADAEPAGLHVPALPPVEMIVSPLAEGGGDDGADRTDGTGVTARPGPATPAGPQAAQPAAVEPAAMTQEMSAAVAQSYADAVPRPTGAAAAAHPPEIPLAPAKRVQARFNPLADWALYLVVFVGGCLGTALRYALTLLLPAPAAPTGFLSAFHTATFLANMCACFLFAGLTAYLSQASWIRRRARQLTSHGVGMGLCGGFSTLSAMVIEELTAIQDGQIGGFIGYALISFIGGLAVAALGVKLALMLGARREARVVAEAVGGAHAAHGAGADGTPRSGFIHVPVGSVPEGDYGQPLPPTGQAGQTGPAGPIGPAAALPAIEPEPVTDEIPLVADPVTGVVRETEPGATGGSGAAGAGRQEARA